MSHAVYSPSVNNGTSSHEHAVLFYESDDHLINSVAEYFAQGFRNGNSMIVIATAAHRDGFRRRLRSLGFNVDSAIRNGQLKELDASRTLGILMDPEEPSPDRFMATIGGMLDSCHARADLPVLAYGEMVDVLWRAGKGGAAIRLEELWNGLAATHFFELLCAYSLRGFCKADHHYRFEQICSSHSRVIPAEHYTEADEGERTRYVSLLQQQALSLQAEIVHRKEVDKALRQTLEERKRAEEQLRKAERQLRSFLENAAEGLHWVGPDGRILWANDAELDLLGYSSEEYIGHNIREFHADSEIIGDILRRLAAGETIQNYEARLRAKDGSIRHALINSNVLWEDGQFVHTQCFTRDVTELKRARNAESFLSAVVESADDAIIGKTLDGMITSWNPGAERIFGYSKEEAIGKPVTILIPPDHVDEEPQILAKLRAGERIDHYETRRIRKDGKIIDISLTVSPVKDSQGHVIGASKIARDITYRKGLEAERDRLLEAERAARNEAESANRMKDEFLAILSHELRTPLNAVLGWVSILESRKDDDLIERALDVIKRNATVQKAMIEDLLDVARVLSGKMVIKNEPVDLRSVIESAIDSVAPAAAAKAIKLDRDLGSAISSLLGDPDRLQQVIWNLLSNSIKFTPQNGSVQVRLAQAGSEVEISVRDTGQGIAPDFLPHVFERFRQGDASTTRQHGGLGVGLAIVRYLAESHGGTVSAQSPGKGLGATFSVRLPITRQS